MYGIEEYNSFILDSILSMENHIKMVCQSRYKTQMYFQVGNLNCSIRKLLSIDTAEILMHAFVTSHLGNGNALFNEKSDQQLVRIFNLFRTTVLAFTQRLNMIIAL